MKPHLNKKKNFRINKKNRKKIKLNCFFVILNQIALIKIHFIVEKVNKAHS